MLAVAVAVLALTGLAALFAERAGPRVPLWTVLAGIALAGVCVALAVIGGSGHGAGMPGGNWLAVEQLPWIPGLGVSLLLAVDGLSLVLLALTGLLGVVAVLVSWNEIDERPGFFAANLAWVLTGVVGVFLALDLLVFFVFWEIMLVPMYLLVALWGHEHRRAAAMEFFLYTQFGGMALLAAVAGLGLGSHSGDAGIGFAFPDILAAAAAQGEPPAWILVGLLVAFLVKLPVVPIHGWLPNAHTEAPTGGSVLLAGVLLKTAGYGLLRFAVPLFPETLEAWRLPLMGLAVAGILYGAWLAFAQSDFKRLVAYSSVAHMGFVLLGVAAAGTLAIQGAVMQMVAHGLATAALFAIAGFLQERLHTRDLAAMGGLWQTAPRLGAATLFFVVAAIGLPGLASFVGEFLTLLGAFLAAPGLAVVAALGVVVAAVYGLALLARSFQGPTGEARLPDLLPRETLVLVLLGVPVVWLGLQPSALFALTGPAVAVLVGGGAGP